MKIFLVCSKHFYHLIDPIKVELESRGHVLTFPNSIENPMLEEEKKKVGAEEHATWKAGMLELQSKKVAANDAILVLNFEKNGQPNYVGGSTFLEIFKAYELGKKIYFFNPLPESMLTDELKAMRPKVINGDLSKIGETP